MYQVTVAICTWNRARLLNQTLAAMRNLRIPPDVDWELLIVNNNCTDETDAVIAKHQDALPIRRLFEPRPGKSKACNLAIAAAQGDLLIWTDDDVLVDPEWIGAYTKAAARWPAVGYFGGAIEPWYECPPPDWIVENLKHLECLLVIRDLGSEERGLLPSERPFGANMAFRTRILKENGFDPNLGPTGNDNIRGEEIVLIDALESRGIQGVWVPRARVKHFITKQRLTRRYLWDWFWGAGRTRARQDRIVLDGKTWFGVPRWILRGAVESWVLAGWRRLWSRSLWVPAYTRAASCFGLIAGAREMARNSQLAQTEETLVNGSRKKGNAG